MSQENKCWVSNSLRGDVTPIARADYRGRGHSMRTRDRLHERVRTFCSCCCKLCQPDSPETKDIQYFLQVKGYKSDRLAIKSRAALRALMRPGASTVLHKQMPVHIPFKHWSCLLNGHERSRPNEQQCQARLKLGH